MQDIAAMCTAAVMSGFRSDVEELRARILQFEKWQNSLQPYVMELHERILQTERLVQYPNTLSSLARCAELDRAEMDNRKVAEQQIALQAQAAQCESTKDLYAPLRTNVDPLVKLANFARRLLDPHDLGHAVSFEVRELAREALGKEKQG